MAVVENHSDNKISDHKMFFMMEQKYNLFDIRTKDNLPIWDIIRYMAYYRLCFKKSANSVNSEFRENKLRLAFKKTFYAFRASYHFFSRLFSSHANFYFGSSRMSNLEGFHYDPYYSNIKDIIPGGVLFYESTIDKLYYNSEPRMFDFLPILKNLIYLIPGYFRRLEKKNEFDYNLIKDAFSDFFNSELLNEYEIKSILNEFRLEYSFYIWLFKIIKIKRIFLIQNGVQKALIQAGKDLGIPSFEFQHGDIAVSTILYNYGDLKKDVKHGVIFPDVLFTYSDIWTEGKSIPSKCIAIGSHHFVDLKPSRNSTYGHIAIITSDEYDEILQKLTIDLSRTFPELNFHYKLHPSQFANFNHFRQRFKTQRNIVVVPPNEKVQDLATYCEGFIVIYSTVMYEILQLNKPLYIYAREHYKVFQEYFDIPLVKIFNDIQEFSQVRKVTIESDAIQYKINFFNAFNPQKFLNSI